MDRSWLRSGHHRGGLLVLGLLAGLLMAHQTVASHAVTKAGKEPAPQGNAEAGRSVFNGKGVCYYCHGIDGYRDKQPRLADDTASLIAQLNPQPADLRNPKALRLKSDKARAKAIREGHAGTSMFPDTTMTDQELADTLAYLSTLRGESASKRKS